MPAASPIIDTNLTLGQWPTRRGPCHSQETPTAKLRAHNVTHAWAGHYDGLFHTNLTEVNDRLALACSSRVPLAPPVLSPNHESQPPANIGSLQLVSFASINPTSPNWESELDRCTTVHK